MSEVLAHANIYTEEDYDNLPENVRAELIDGHIYYMAAPSRVHQEILNYMNTEINIYLRSKKGPCKVYPAPFAVKLFSENDKISIRQLQALLILDLFGTAVVTLPRQTVNSAGNDGGWSPECDDERKRADRIRTV